MNSGEFLRRLEVATTAGQLGQALDWLCKEQNRNRSQVFARIKPGVAGLRRSSFNYFLAGTKPIPNKTILLALAVACCPSDEAQQRTMIRAVLEAWDRISVPRDVPEPRKPLDDVMTTSTSNAEAEADHLRTLEVMAEVAGKLTDPATLPQALELYEHVLSTRRRLLGDPHRETFTASHNLGKALAEAKRFDAARVQLSRAYEGRRTLLGARDAASLSSMDALAYVHSRMGELVTAKMLLQECLELWQKNLDDAPEPERDQLALKVRDTAAKLERLQRA
ncbi:tetratricopeptide repeat protein [Actinoplanes sp. TFC3]|uniref:tetratricopeptide repeat protein n=1 Tax=Actinoplanes sp. TFC3 TaxID=1710355 RepID=UPI0008306AD7|nr:tetratricopeptide repeat protein [Actinoplanes sp. TFC3]